MALKIGNIYTRICKTYGAVDYFSGMIRLETWRDEDLARGINRTEFDTCVQQTVYAPALIDAVAQPASSAASVKDNVITAGYVALKALPQFATAEDC